MQTTEMIPVYVCLKKGKTKCICHANAKGCGRRCDRDVVERDKFREWEKTMVRDKCGK